MPDLRMHAHNPVDWYSWGLEAFAKAERAAGRPLPHGGTVFLSVRDDDKATAIPVAAALVGLGFQLVATGGTARTLHGAGLDVDEVRKVSVEGEEPSVVDLIRRGRCNLVINTPEGGSGPRSDGYLIREAALAAITGLPKMTLQPNSGANGEYAGLVTIRNYHAARGEGRRDVCLIPSSAHGTNPASARMAGLEVAVVACDAHGNVDLADLKAKLVAYAGRVAALMITYPSTHGVYEEAAAEICALVHAAGGQVYMDGANLNALAGLARVARRASPWRRPVPAALLLASLFALALAVARRDRLAASVRLLRPGVFLGLRLGRESVQGILRLPLGPFDRALSLLDRPELFLRLEGLLRRGLRRPRRFLLADLELLKLGRGLGLVPSAAPGQRRGHRGDHQHSHGHAEDDHQAMMERLGDEFREEPLTGEGGDAAGRQVREYPGRPEQLMHRVVAEEGREQAPDRGQLPDRVRDRGRDTLARQPVGQRRRQRRGQARDHEREEHPDGQHEAGVLEGGEHPRGGAPLAGGHAVHDRRRIGRGEQARAGPVHHQEGGEAQVREVDGQEREPDE